MPQHKLHIVFLQISLLNLADYALKMNNHYHFILVRSPSTEIHSTTLELEHAIGLRHEVGRVVDQFLESLRPIILMRLHLVTSSRGVQSLIILQLLLVLFTLAEFD